MTIQKAKIKGMLVIKFSIVSNLVSEINNSTIMLKSQVHFLIIQKIHKI